MSVEPTKSITSPWFSMRLVVFVSGTLMLLVLLIVVAVDLNRQTQLIASQTEAHYNRGLRPLAQLQRELLLLKDQLQQASLRLSGLQLQSDQVESRFRVALLPTVLYDDNPDIYHQVEVLHRRWTPIHSAISKLDSEQPDPVQLLAWRTTLGDLEVEVNSRLGELEVLQGATLTKMADRHHRLATNSLVGLSLFLIFMALSVGAAMRLLWRQHVSNTSLAASEARYRHFFEYDLTGDFVADEDGRILDSNPAFRKMFDLMTPQDVASSRLPTLFEDPAAYAALIAQLRDNPGMSYHEAAMLRKDGRTIHVVANFQAEASRQGNLRITGYLFDNSELKHQQELLRRATKLEALGRLTGGIAHDFNNILTAIIGYSEFIVDEPGDADLVRQNATEIVRASQRAAALTRRLLAFSRQQILAPTALSLNDTLTGMEELLRRLIPESIVLKLRLADDMELVRADLAQMEQVILNLALNGRDAMPSGGVVTLSTRMVTLSADSTLPLEPGRWGVIEVQDTGTGMSDNVKDRLFEPFFTTKGQGQGTGLGLATVYGIVQQSKGHIEVESAIGRGTLMRVYMPLAAEDLPLATVAAKEETSRANQAYRPIDVGMILVAEDDDMVADYVASILSRHGYLVRPLNAPSLAASELPEDLPVGLLITDVIMPSISGMELAEALRERRPDMPILFMTGYPEGLDLASRPDLQPSRLLEKPFTPQGLLRVVRDILNEARFAAARGKGKGSGKG